MLSFSDQHAGWACRFALRTTFAVVPVLRLSGNSAGGQTVPAQEGAGGPYTLHVYTDLLQIPTVALTRLHGSYRELTAQRFTISLDSGPGFHPTHIRSEGDDPVSLAIYRTWARRPAGRRSFRLSRTRFRPSRQACFRRAIQLPRTRTVAN